MFDPSQVGSIFLWLELGRAIYGFGLENFPLKMTNFFPFESKKSVRVGSKAGWPLIYYGSKVSSGRAKAHLWILYYK